MFSSLRPVRSAEPSAEQEQREGRAIPGFGAENRFGYGLLHALLVYHASLSSTCLL